MSTMACQITSLRIFYSTVYSGADQRKHQSSASLAFVWWIHRWQVNSPHKGPVTREMFPFDDVIMSQETGVTCSGMVTLWTVNSFRITGHHNRSVLRSFDLFFVVSLNQLLKKQSIWLIWIMSQEFTKVMYYHYLVGMQYQVSSKTRWSSLIKA